jgi:hypothetical protein
MTVHKTAIHKTKKVQDDNAQDDNAQNDDLQDHNVKNMSGLEIEHQDDNKADPPAHENPSSDSNSEAEHMSIVDTYDATYDTIVASITVLIDDVKENIKKPTNIPSNGVIADYITELIQPVKGIKTIIEYTTYMLTNNNIIL